MGKSIETELREYFVGNINSRIDKLQEEIAALKRFKAKMLGRVPTADKPVKEKPKRKLSAAHKKALMEGKARALAAKKGKS